MQHQLPSPVEAIPAPAPSETADADADGGTRDAMFDALRFGDLEALPSIKAF